MRAVELFAGAGGLALGLKRAGFSCVRAYERNPYAVSTLRAAEAASKSDEIVQADLGAISVEDWRTMGLGVVDLLAGGPPCQPFSVGGKGRGVWDARDGFPHFLRAVEGIEPLALLIENVKGLASAKHRPYLAAVCNALTGCGYHTQWTVLNAARYGVPQMRERIFVVGFRHTAHAAQFTWPRASHARPATMRDALGTPLGVTAWCSDGGRSKLPPHRPVHGLDEPCMTQRAQHGGGGSGVLLLGGSDLDGAERVIYANGSTAAVKHGFRATPTWFARRMRPFEAARIQGFPDEYPFAGGVSERYRMIGNAVPPRMGEVVGCAIMSAMGAR